MLWGCSRCDDTLPPDAELWSDERPLGPFLKFNNESANEEFGVDHDSRESFFSGHAISAFFAMAFADRVLADIVRSAHGDHCLSCGVPWPGRLARLAQAALLYGVATYVGYSRIEIDQHFMTDVLAGAAVGALVAQMTYLHGYGSYRPGGLAFEPASFPGGIALRWHF